MLPSHPPSSHRKRILINIDKQSKKCKQKPSYQDSNANASGNVNVNVNSNTNSNSNSESIFNPVKDIPKLIEISEGCMQYYEIFLENRLGEEQYLEMMFGELIRFLDETFRDLKEIISSKENQLRTSIIQKKRQLTAFHPTHLLSLTQKIQKLQCHKLSLQKQTTFQKSLFTLSFDSYGQIKQSEYCQLTKLLHSFNNQMQEIERMNFNQCVRVSTKFLRNLVNDQYEMYCRGRGADRQPAGRGEGSGSGSGVEVSFQNQGLFSGERGLGKEDVEETDEDGWQMFKANVDRSQRDLENKINHYVFGLKAF